MAMADAPRDSCRVDPHKRLMAAVLHMVIDDCRGSAYRRARGFRTPVSPADFHRATAYVASKDRTWPFSFENLCEALGLDSGRLRRELQTTGECDLTTSPAPARSYPLLPTLAIG